MRTTIRVSACAQCQCIECLNGQHAECPFESDLTAQPRTQRANRRLIAGGVVAAGLMLGGAALVLGAGLAKADTYGYEGDMSGAAYAMEMHADGMSGDAASAFGLGMTICEKRAEFSREEVIEYAETMYPSDLSIDMVMNAEWHFCPQFDGLHPGEVA